VTDWGKFGSRLMTVGWAVVTVGSLVVILLRVT
jgi:hypothetical protein